MRPGGRLGGRFVLYYDGRHYDSREMHPTSDIEFWKKLAAQLGDPVLELACGTGRITIPLALAGREVSGLDILPSMIDQGRRKAAAKGCRINWVEGDCRDFDLCRTYSLVFIPYNSMNHLETLADLEACFRCVKRHMNSRSRFAFDIFNPRLDLLQRDPSQEYPHSAYDDPDGRGRIVITENNLYDPATQINTVRLFFRLPDGTTARDDLICRMWFPREIDAILKYNGFIIEDKFGDYDETPFRGDSPKQIVLCRKEG
jgi:SAM-dependent methyltransferase